MIPGLEESSRLSLSLAQRYDEDWIRSGLSAFSRLQCTSYQEHDKDILPKQAQFWNSVLQLLQLESTAKNKDIVSFWFKILWSKTPQILKQNKFYADFFIFENAYEHGKANTPTRPSAC